MVGRARPAAPVAMVAGFGAGASQEMPALVPVLTGATLWVVDRAARGQVPARSVVVALAAGLGAGLVTRRSWPVAPREPAQARRHLTRAGVTPLPDGAGLSLVVNASAGPALRPDAGRIVREALPAARVFEVEEGGDLTDTLRQAAAADGVAAIGVAGGDGSVNTAADIAMERDLPLVIIPAGTLNHLARDLGLETAEDAIDAVRRGEIAEIDVGDIDGRPFLNTLSLGVYPALVDARERLEGVLGKWPAVAVALVRVLRRGSAFEIDVDGRRRRLWMIFVGNCHYHPSGFAPGWRQQLDDGVLDVRLVDGSRPLARTRLLLAVLSGRLGRSTVYEQCQASSLSLRSLDGPLRPARDGETFDGSTEMTVSKRDRRLPRVRSCGMTPAKGKSQAWSRRPTRYSRPSSATTPAPVSHGPAAS